MIEDPSKSHWPASLRTILLAMVIIALCVAQFVAIQNVRNAQATNRQLSDEIAKLRTEAGYLTVKDPSRVYLVRIPAIDEFTWRWRVYLPEGEWTLHAATSDIPPRGVMKRDEIDSTIGGREIIFTVGVRKGVEDEWQLVTEMDHYASRQSLSTSHPLAQPGFKETLTSIAGFSGDEEVHDPDKHLELLRIRAMNNVDTQSPDEANSTSGEGVLIWFERKPTQH